MKAVRKRYGAEFKAKVALEAIKGQRTTNEIAAAYGVHPSMVIQWRKLAINGLPQALSNGQSHTERADEELKQKLYEEIGRLKVELEWLKKKSGLGR